MSFGNRGITRFLCDYISSFEHGKHRNLQHHTEYFHGTAKASGPLYEIYLRNIPLMPTYGGHVPGAKFRYGDTYGTDSVDAKRTFRELN